MHQQNHAIPDKTFFFWWIAAGIFVWPISIFIGVVTFVGIGIALAILEEFGFPVSLSWTEYQSIETMLAITFLGGVIGYTVGMLQQMIFRRQLYWELAGWRKKSTIGGVIGGIFVALSMMFIANFDYNPTTPIAILTIPLFLLILSSVQYSSLRQSVKFASLWILANVAAGLIVTSLVLLNPISRFDPIYPLKITGLFIVAGLAPGIITGSTIAHLFENYAYPIESEEDKSGSIWDQAI